MHIKKAKEIPNNVGEFLSYDEHSPSCLIWIKKPKHTKICIGDCAGYLDSKNRWCVKFENKLYKVHRIIWFLDKGELDPLLEIDHDDRDPSNNKHSNLKEATCSDNNCNKIEVITKSTDLPKGINFSKSPGALPGYMVARLYKNGKSVSKSSHSLSELVEWIKENRLLIHKGFANNGEKVR